MRHDPMLRSARLVASIDLTLRAFKARRWAGSGSDDVPAATFRAPAVVRGKPCSHAKRTGEAD